MLANQEFQRWTWVHGGGQRDLQDWNSAYAQLADAGFHGVLVGGGEPEVHAEAAHANGLEYHRWIWTLNRSGDPWVKDNHPEWFTISRNGESSLTDPPYVGYYQWLCPTRPEVRAYVRDSMARAATVPGVDGIHLDYVRHSDVILPRGLWAKYDLVQDQEHPEFDFCYCEVCRSTFEADHGLDPMALPDPPSDERWRQFRWDAVTGLVNAVSTGVGEVGKPLSAAVFPTPSIARTLVRQAWDEWPVDTVFPMLYNSFYKEGLQWIGEGVREGLAALAARSGQPGPDRLIAGLYLPTLPDGERLYAAEIAKEAGAHGVSFFEFGGLQF
jgi:uncharacterized lipoprotein YddW (UPF0748 family)